MRKQIFILITLNKLKQISYQVSFATFNIAFLKHPDLCVLGAWQIRGFYYFKEGGAILQEKNTVLLNSDVWLKNSTILSMFCLPNAFKSYFTTTIRFFHTLISFQVEVQLYLSPSPALGLTTFYSFCMARKCKELFLKQLNFLL